MNSPSNAIIEYQGQRYLVADGEVMLDALLRQGANVAHSCGKGTCHTCVLRLESGDVQYDKDVDADIRDSGHVLPCVAHARGEVCVAPPELDRLAIPGEIVSRRELGGDVFEIGIAPLRDMPFDGGQHLQLVRADGVSRSYSIASLPEDDFFFLVHVKHVPGGAMSGWLCADAPIGERLNLFAPRGECRYQTSMAGRPLHLVATGSGAGAMHAIARAALAAGHDAPITLFHGVRSARDLHLDAPLRELARQHANFRYVPCLSGARDASWPSDAHAGRVTTAAFDTDLADAEVFLCGSPAMVEDARCLAVERGARRDRIHADPFDEGGLKAPRDSEKIAAIGPDPELWEALERGPRMRRILETFYERVYADERLSPFFEGLPREQVIGKQYAFLADLFSGKRDYFGMRPYNAHHWMVISDELFDYREAMFEQALRDHGLPEPMIRRWEALHERFRAEIVKPVARGMIIGGKEVPLRNHEVETLDIDAVCDGCGREIGAGERARYQHRLGTLHCATCAGIAPEAKVA